MILAVICAKCCPGKGGSDSSYSGGNYHGGGYCGGIGVGGAAGGW